MRGKAQLYGRDPLVWTRDRRDWRRKVHRHSGLKGWFGPDEIPIHVSMRFVARASRLRNSQKYESMVALLDLYIVLMEVNPPMSYIALIPYYLEFPLELLQQAKRHFDPN